MQDQYSWVIYARREAKSRWYVTRQREINNEGPPLILRYFSRNRVATGRAETEAYNPLPAGSIACYPW